MMGWLAGINWFWQPLCDAVIEPDLLFIKCIKNYTYELMTELGFCV